MTKKMSLRVYTRAFGNRQIKKDSDAAKISDALISRAMLYLSAVCAFELAISFLN
jgi:hypothetical protein